MTKDEYKQYLNNVKGYNTLQEKNALLLSFVEESSPEDFKKTLEFETEEIKSTNDLETIAMIFKSREKSVDENIGITMACDHCNFMTLYSIPIDSLFFNENNGILDESIPIRLMDSIDDIYHEIGNIDNLSLKEIQEIEEKVTHNNKIIFNPVTKITCKKCLLENKLKINYRDIISKNTIKNLYEQYLDITQYTNMTKQDVDNLPPFEREIFINLIQERENKKE
jgi:hypothetical protein